MLAGGSRWLGRSGVNRNQFYSVRIGQAMNTGVQIDAGDTNQVSPFLLHRSLAGSCLLVTSWLLAG